MNQENPENNKEGGKSQKKSHLWKDSFLSYRNSSKM